MRHVAIARSNTQVARPLKILVPLIKDELSAADEAGLEHYRKAGEMLIESKGQVPHGSWSRWLTKNFELSQTTANRYVRLARIAEKDDDSKLTARGQFEHDENPRSLTSAIGERPARAAWKPIYAATDRVNVDRLADERQSRENEIKLHRELALQLIDLGYRTLATRLHPDRGGSREAMGRLNLVRDELKSIAATRRFI